MKQTPRPSTHTQRETRASMQSCTTDELPEVQLYHPAPSSSRRPVRGVSFIVQGTMLSRHWRRGKSCFGNIWRGAMEHSEGPGTRTSPSLGFKTIEQLRCTVDALCYCIYSVCTQQFLTRKLRCARCGNASKNN